MKKLLLILLIGILFISCEKPLTKTYYIEYEIHYPDRTDTLSAVKEFYYEPKVQSERGSNVIYYIENHNDIQINQSLIETSAPLNIITIIEQ